MECSSYRSSSLGKSSRLNCSSNRLNCSSRLNSSRLNSNSSQFNKSIKVGESHSFNLLFSDLKNDSNTLDKHDPRLFTIEDYSVWKAPIGEGSFSEVFKGFHQDTKRVVAIKSLRVNKKNKLNRIKFEINIMQNLDHPNIVKLYEIVEEDDNKIHLVMEYCSGGTLEKFIENNEILNESQVHYYLKDLSQGLKYLRTKNILHRDLKPHNLLISEDNKLKISDFGLSTELENDKMTDTLCGSPLYMAPEIITNNVYGVKSDLWSVGVIMYQLIYGKHPYQFKNIYELIQEINTKEIEFPCNQVSANCLNLMKKLLIVNTNQRICWGEFFKDPWITAAEFVTESYKISQPVKIRHKSDGYLSKYTIKDYNPSFYQYDPVVNSEPTNKTKYINSNSSTQRMNLKNSSIKKKWGGNTSYYKKNPRNMYRKHRQITNSYIDPSTNNISVQIQDFNSREENESRENKGQENESLENESESREDENHRKDFENRKENNFGKTNNIDSKLDKIYSEIQKLKEKEKELIMREEELNKREASTNSEASIDNDNYHKDILEGSSLFSSFYDMLRAPFKYIFHY